MKFTFQILLVLVIFSAFQPVQLLGKGKPKKLSFEETTYEGKPHFVIEIKEITWYFDKEGGSFSRMIDRDGNDWISFKREPCKTIQDKINDEVWMYKEIDAVFFWNDFLGRF